MSVHLRGTDKFLGHAKNVDFIINFQEKIINKIKNLSIRIKFQKYF